MTICLSLSNMETHPAQLRRTDNVQPRAHLVSYKQITLTDPSLSPESLDSKLNAITHILT